ncbi:MAG: hypothetical protein KKA84_14900 [Bacteroidetes bacterium]|nr:hypothetical protein [Bacteroidota bacterium]
MSSQIKIKVSSSNSGIRVKGKLDDEASQRESLEEMYKKQIVESYTKGLNEGQQQIRTELENTYTNKLLEKFNQLHGMFSDFDERILEYENAFEKIVIAVSLDIAEKVIKRELEMKSTIQGNLKESLKKVMGANNVLVRLNPDDYLELTEDGGDFLNDGAYSRMKFESDDRINKGGCFVETEIGNVDSRVSTQLNEIKKQLEATYSEEVV